VTEGPRKNWATPWDDLEPPVTENPGKNLTIHADDKKLLTEEPEKDWTWLIVVGVSLILIATIACGAYRCWVRRKERGTNAFRSTAAGFGTLPSWSTGSQRPPRAPSMESMTSYGSHLPDGYGRTATSPVCRELPFREEIQPGVPNSGHVVTQKARMQQASKYGNDKDNGVENNI